MPKPRMALQIGIAGHRSNKLDSESRTAVDHALRTLYAMIGEAIAKIALETQDRIYSTAAPLIRIVSGLAEGADRIAITAAPADSPPNSMGACGQSYCRADLDGHLGVVLRPSVPQRLCVDIHSRRALGADRALLFVLSGISGDPGLRSRPDNACARALP